MVVSAHDAIVQSYFLNHFLGTSVHPDIQGRVRLSGYIAELSFWSLPILESALALH